MSAICGKGVRDVQYVAESTQHLHFEVPGPRNCHRTPPAGSSPSRPALSLMISAGSVSTPSYDNISVLVF